MEITGIHMNMKKNILFLLLLMTAAVVNAQEQEQKKEPNDTVLMKVARQYRYGIMREVNPSKAAKIYMHLARKNNADAMNELGKMYLNGDGVEKSPKRAMALFGKSAKQGNAKAMCNLALMYQKGIGVNTNYRKAFLLYKAASEKGSARGDYGTGFFLYKGMGVKQNYDEAVRYLERGSAKGHSGCTFLLGSYYANGFGDEQDIKKAEGYFSMASKQGDRWAVDVEKRGLLDTIAVRRSRVKAVRREKIPTPEFLPANYGTTRIENLIGRWEGILYTYDWSNTKIADTQPMTCEFEAFGDSTAMLCYVGDSLVTIYTPFERGNFYYENKLKSYQKEFPWVITRCQYERNDDFLTLRFRSLNTKSRDYRRPMVMSLHKVDVNSDNEATGIQDASFDNGMLSLDVNAANSADVTFHVYSINGTLVKTLRKTSLNSGANSLSYEQLSLSQGLYIIEGTIGGKTFSKKLTVK